MEYQRLVGGKSHFCPDPRARRHHASIDCMAWGKIRRQSVRLNALLVADGRQFDPEAVLQCHTIGAQRCIQHAISTPGNFHASTNLAGLT